jgi:hypothetical protein
MLGNPASLPDREGAGASPHRAAQLHSAWARYKNNVKASGLAIASDLTTHAISLLGKPPTPTESRLQCLLLNTTQVGTNHGNL